MPDPILRETHPRPQLLRERWVDMGGPWGFAFDDEDAGLDARWWAREDVLDRTITAPFPPESAASGIHDPGPRRAVWYRRAFAVDARGRADGGRILLHFGAVDYAARVWVNGQLVATHEGGHTPFSADITTALGDDDTEQVIVVRAEDDPADLAMPRGKQDWQTPPHGIWYHRTTGIWQPFWLEPVPARSIREVRWTPDIDRGVLGLEVALDGPATADMAVRVTLQLDDRTLADEQYAVAGSGLSREIVLAPGGVVH